MLKCSNVKFLYVIFVIIRWNKTYGVDKPAYKHNIMFEQINFDSNL